MRILIISAWFPSRLHPRHGNFVMRFAERMAERHTVEVVSVEEDAGLPARTVRVEAHRGAGYAYRTAFYGRGRGGRVGRLLNRGRAWRRVLATVRTRPDIVHAHVLVDGGIVAEQWARRRNIPVFITEHASRYLRGDFGNPLERGLARRAARRAAVVLPVSDGLRTAMQASGIVANFTVLPNFVDESEFRLMAESTAERPFRILHVSDFSPNKNVAGLLAAAQLLNAQKLAFELWLAGDGDVLTLQRQIKETGFPPGQITVSGPHEPAEIARLMRQSDLFVLNSGYETQGIVLIESLLCGTPCLTTDAAGAAEIINSDSCFGSVFAQTGGPEELARLLAEKITAGPSPPALRQQISAHARERYASASVRQQLEALYAQHLRPDGSR